MINIQIILASILGLDVSSVVVRRHHHAADELS